MRFIQRQKVLATCMKWFGNFRLVTNCCWEMGSQFWWNRIYINETYCTRKVSSTCKWWHRLCMWNGVLVFFFLWRCYVKWYFPHFNYNALIESTFCLSFIRCMVFFFRSETNAWVLCQVNVKFANISMLLFKHSNQHPQQSAMKRLTHVNLITFLYVCAYNRFPFCLD